MGSDLPVERIIDKYGVDLWAERPLRWGVLRHLGAAWFWALVSSTLFAISAGLLFIASAEGWMYAAFGLASVGLFLCTWGSVFGIGELLGQMDNFERSLDGSSTLVKGAVVDRLRTWASTKRAMLLTLAFGVGITACFILQNHTQPNTMFAEAFRRTQGALYLPLFVVACAIGAGHTCIAGALGVARLFGRFGLRRTYSPAPVRFISVRYLLLATLCLATYIVCLGFLLAVRADGVGLSFAMYAIAVDVGVVVGAVYLYPQWKIHRALVANRAELIAEALDHLESSRNRTGPTRSDERERLLKSLDYVRAMESFPMIGFHWRELLGVLIGYLLPVIGFLLAQGPRFESFFE